MIASPTSDYANIGIDLSQFINTNVNINISCECDKNRDADWIVLKDEKVSSWKF